MKSKWCLVIFLLLASTQAGAADNTLRVGKAQWDPATAHTLSMVLPTQAGDANRNGKVAVAYRVEGEDEWKESLDLFRHDRGKGGNQPFAGMLFNLQADTAYEVKLMASDPDGVEGEAAQILKGRTRAIPARVEAGAENTVKVATYAELTGAIKAAKPGQVILLEKGTYKGKVSLANLKGEPGKPIIVRGSDRVQCVVEGSVTISNCKHVHLEDLTIAHGGKGIAVRDYPAKGCEDIVIRGMLILGVDVGIDAKEGHTNLYIVNNVLIGNNVFGDVSNRTWNDEGIVVTGQGIEVAYNTLAGFGDSMGMSHQTNQPNRGIDIHHNLVVWGGDDGVENDFTDRNAQTHHNLLTNTANGLSCQMVWYGPAYLFKNVTYNLYRGPYKIKPERTSNDGVFVMHNTTINAGRAYTNFSGRPGTVAFINNLFTGDGKQKDVVRADTSKYHHLIMSNNAWFYDGQYQIDRIFKKNFEGWKSTEQGKNDVLLAGEKTFANLEFDFVDRGFEHFRNPHADFSLNKDSKAVDAGKVLPGINDGFSGKAPDIGAWEIGEEPPKYGAFQDDTPPEVPQDLQAAGESTTSIKVSWKASTDPDSGIACYALYRNDALVAMVAGATEYLDKGLDEAAEYSYCIAAVNGGIRMSEKSAALKSATLADKTPPAMVKAEAPGSKNNELLVFFSEPVEQTSAETAAHYAVDNGVTVEKAALRPDKKGVLLTTSALNEGVKYTLTVKGVKDLAKAPNVIEGDARQAFDYVALEMIVDFGGQPGVDQYGKGWMKTIRDTYTNNCDDGPGGMTVHAGNSNATYNFQGVTAEAKQAFAAGDRLVVTWYNNTKAAMKFTPKVTLDGDKRPRAGGTWWDMSPVALGPGESGRSVYELKAGGEFGVVSVNDNIQYGAAKSLICDKIEVQRKK